MNSFKKSDLKMLECLSWLRYGAPFSSMTKAVNSNDCLTLADMDEKDKDALKDYEDNPDNYPFTSMVDRKTKDSKIDYRLESRRAHNAQLEQNLNRPANKEYGELMGLLAQNESQFPLKITPVEDDPSSKVSGAYTPSSHSFNYIASGFGSTKDHTQSHETFHWGQHVNNEIDALKPGSKKEDYEFPFSRQYVQNGYGPETNIDIEDHLKFFEDHYITPYGLDEMWQGLSLIGKLRLLSKELKAGIQDTVESRLSPGFTVAPITDTINLSDIVADACPDVYPLNINCEFDVPYGYNLFEEPYETPVRSMMSYARTPVYATHAQAHHENGKPNYYHAHGLPVGPSPEFFPRLNRVMRENTKADVDNLKDFLAAHPNMKLWKSAPLRKRA